MKPSKLKLLFQHFSSGKTSLRKRFVMYIVSAIIAFVALTLVLFYLFGLLNPANAQIMKDLDTCLTTGTDKIAHDNDALAACAISFSRQLESQIQDYLTDQQITFADLRDNTQAITDLQCRLYDTVYLNMQVAPASGAFYILNTTVNSASAASLYNGIYLKYVNLSSENAVNNEFALYRGSYTAGKENGVVFHSGWNNENKTDFFDNCDQVFTPGVHYALSSVVEIPETWEHARYIYVPVRDRQGSIIGVCGFEISDLLFQLSHKTVTSGTGQIVCGLLDRHQGHYHGQFNSNRYQIRQEGHFQMISQKDLTRFEFGEESCIGITKDIVLGNDTFTVAVMMPYAQYQNFIRDRQLQNALIFLILGILAFVVCGFLSHKYVSPIRKRIAQVQKMENVRDPSKIREIDDLFAFLETRDVVHEKRLEELEQEIQAAQNNAAQSQLAYEKALRKLDLVQSELSQLMGARQKEIVPEEYEFFISNLASLTPTEYKVYELYLSGKNAKEIAQILNISENTLKYHNKNIYSKLGVSSRKQLLRFAALKQHQDKKSETE